MFVLPRLPRRLAMVLVSCAAGLASGCTVALAGSPKPTVHTSRGCYQVGQRVIVRGAGFTPSRAFDITIDGVDFGQSQTDSAGGFSSPLIPGGLAAGQAQQVDQLNATDGVGSANTTFTVTRRAGGRFLATRGNPHTLRAPFEVWGFAPNGSPRSVYLHYLSPTGQVRMTARIGQTGGQCGYLRTTSRRVFPFSPSLGEWTLQLDTRRPYAKSPGGPVATVRVAIH